MSVTVKVRNDNTVWQPNKIVMKKIYLTLTGLVASFALGFYLNTVIEKETLPDNPIVTPTELQNSLKLGAFSVSLSVKDLKTSKEFYERLGFDAFAGSMEQNYLIMKNDHALIGLFQGMFQGNILTFNPGWDENASNVENFDDIRKIQQQLKNSGLALLAKPTKKQKALRV